MELTLLFSRIKAPDGRLCECYADDMVQCCLEHARLGGHAVARWRVGRADAAGLQSFEQWQGAAGGAPSPRAAVVLVMTQEHASRILVASPELPPREQVHLVDAAGCCTHGGGDGAAAAAGALFAHAPLVLGAPGATQHHAALAARVATSVSGAAMLLAYRARLAATAAAASVAPALAAAASDPPARRRVTPQPAGGPAGGGVSSSSAGVSRLVSGLVGLPSAAAASSTSAAASSAAAAPLDPLHGVPLLLKRRAVEGANLDKVQRELEELKRSAAAAKRSRSRSNRSAGGAGGAASAAAAGDDGGGASLLDGGDVETSQHDGGSSYGDASLLPPAPHAHTMPARTGATAGPTSFAGLLSRGASTAKPSDMGDASFDRSLQPRQAAATAIAAGDAPDDTSAAAAPATADGVGGNGGGSRDAAAAGLDAAHHLVRQAVMALRLTPTGGLDPFAPAPAGVAGSAASRGSDVLAWLAADAPLHALLSVDPRHSRRFLKAHHRQGGKATGAGAVAPADAPSAALVAAATRDDTLRELLSAAVRVAVERGTAGGSDGGAEAAADDGDGSSSRLPATSSSSSSAAASGPTFASPGRPLRAIAQQLHDLPTGATPARPGNEGGGLLDAPSSTVTTGAARGGWRCASGLPPRMLCVLYRLRRAYWALVDPYKKQQMQQQRAPGPRDASEWVHDAHGTLLDPQRFLAQEVPAAVALLAAFELPAAAPQQLSASPAAPGCATPSASAGSAAAGRHAPGVPASPARHAASAAAPASPSSQQRQRLGSGSGGGVTSSTPFLLRHSALRAAHAAVAASDGAGAASAAGGSAGTPARPVAAGASASPHAGLLALRSPSRALFGASVAVAGGSAAPPPHAHHSARKSARPARRLRNLALEAFHDRVAELQLQHQSLLLWWPGAHETSVADMVRQEAAAAAATAGGGAAALPHRFGLVAAAALVREFCKEVLVLPLDKLQQSLPPAVQARLAPPPAAVAADEPGAAAAAAPAAGKKPARPAWLTALGGNAKKRPRKPQAAGVGGGDGKASAPAVPLPEHVKVRHHTLQVMLRLWLAATDASAIVQPTSESAVADISRAASSALFWVGVASSPEQHGLPFLARATLGASTSVTSLWLQAVVTEPFAARLPDVAVAVYLSRSIAPPPELEARAKSRLQQLQGGGTAGGGDATPDRRRGDVGVDASQQQLLSQEDSDSDAEAPGGAAAGARAPKPPQPEVAAPFSPIPVGKPARIRGRQLAPPPMPRQIADAMAGPEPAAPPQQQQQQPQPAQSDAATAPPRLLVAQGLGIPEPSPPSAGLMGGAAAAFARPPPPPLGAATASSSGALPPAKRFGLAAAFQFGLSSRSISAAAEPAASPPVEAPIDASTPSVAPVATLAPPPPAAPISSAAAAPQPAPPPPPPLQRQASTVSASASSSSAAAAKIAPTTAAETIRFGLQLSSRFTNAASGGGKPAAAAAPSSSASSSSSTAAAASTVSGAPSLAGKKRPAAPADSQSSSEGRGGSRGEPSSSNSSSSRPAAGAAGSGGAAAAAAASDPLLQARKKQAVRLPSAAVFESTVHKVKDVTVRVHTGSGTGKDKGSKGPKAPAAGAPPR